MSKVFKGITPEAFKTMKDLFIAQNRQVIEAWEAIKAADATQLTVEEPKTTDEEVIPPDGDPV